MNIHPLAVVSPQAQLATGVSIGPFAVVEGDAIIGEGCRVAAHAVIKDGTSIGPNTEICEAAIVGGHPQHLKKAEVLGRLYIGANNTIREHATLHRAMKPDAATVIGDNNLLMAGAHVAHDCKLGNNIVLANNVLLAGHVTIADRAFISGAVAIHQFCRVGTLAMVGGLARVVQDVPPYVMVDGGSACIVGLNLVGLRRAGFSTDQIAELKRAYRVIYRRGLKWSEVIETLKAEFATGPAAAFHEFLSGGTRGFIQERRMPPGATIRLRTDSEDAASTSDDGPISVLPEVRTKAG